MKEIAVPINLFMCVNSTMEVNIIIFTIEGYLINDSSTLKNLNNMKSLFGPEPNNDNSVVDFGILATAECNFIMDKNFDAQSRSIIDFEAEPEIFLKKSIKKNNKQFISDLITKLEKTNKPRLSSNNLQYINDVIDCNDVYYGEMVVILRD